jgi:hypothetical protein
MISSVLFQPHPEVTMATPTLFIESTTPLTQGGLELGRFSGSRSSHRTPLGCLHTTWSVLWEEGHAHPAARLLLK